MTALDPKNLIVANAWLKAKTALPVAPAALSDPASYDIDFCPFEDLSVKVEGDLKEIWNPGPGGGLGLLDVRRVKAKLTYEADLKNLPAKFLEYYMGAASGSAPVPGKVVKLYCWLGMAGEGEPIVTGGSNIGDGIFSHYGFAAAVTVDGDLKADGENFASPKLTVRVLLGLTPGNWKAGARPVVQLP